MPQARLLLCVLLLFALSACATPASEAPARTPPSFGDSSRFGPRPNLPTPDELHRLTAAQQADFLAYFQHPARAGVAPHRRLYEYLDEIVADFRYRPETLSASEVLESNGGNCLSLAMLTTALAQVANIEIGYQLMDDQPVFEYQNSVVIKGVHISSIVYNPDWGASALPTSPGLRIDYFPELRGRFLANLDRNGYLALYYDNIASDAIARGDYDTAYWYLREALQYAPTHGATLNMLAVVNRRKGALDTAEAIYRYGIAQADDKLSLLKNYHTLLVARGRQAEADAVQLQLDTMNDPSPLHWLQLARTSHADGDWENAIHYYQRVLQLAPYMHEVHLGLAQSYHAAGMLQRAESELSAAVALANRVSVRNLYKAKLLNLRGEI